jgi:hypothetical protein
VSSKPCLLLAVLFLSVNPAKAALHPSATKPCYTLQVASFPSEELANKFVVELVAAGEHPMCATVEVSGRGNWTRVFVGLFDTVASAGRHGEALIGRGVIKEFLVRRADASQAAIRPRKVIDSQTSETDSSKAAETKLMPSDQDERCVTNNDNLKFHMQLEASPESSQHVPVEAAPLNLPFLPLSLQMSPPIDTTLIPRPDPIVLALKLIIGESKSFSSDPAAKRGLWLSGDTDEGLSRLRWIVGDENAELLTVEPDGHLRIDAKLLAKAAGLEEPRVEDAVQVATYIASNEGLLLITQLSEGRYRYLLHMGSKVSTRGKTLEISAGVNLDNNYDSRINPLRKHCEKLDVERPPVGFDSLVGLNPGTRWVNLRSNSFVPVGEITFHELAEAHAKLELGLGYLDEGSTRGAHALAIEREQRLKSQRPGVVLTAGSNLVLRTEEDLRLFYTESSRGISQR